MTETCGQALCHGIVAGRAAYLCRSGFVLPGVARAGSAVLPATAARSLDARRMPSGDVAAGSRRFGFFRFVAYFDTPCSGCRDIRSSKPSGGIRDWQVPKERSLTAAHDSLTIAMTHSAFCL
jgi:hypothetical protein